MTALNAIGLADDGSYAFGIFAPDAETTAELGRTWMRMLTLQLGMLLEPYLPGAVKARPAAGAGSQPAAL